jgi:hypothetical protein
MAPAACAAPCMTNDRRWAPRPMGNSCTIETTFPDAIVLNAASAPASTNGSTAPALAFGAPHGSNFGAAKLPPSPTRGTPANAMYVAVPANNAARRL